MKSDTNGATSSWESTETGQAIQRRLSEERTLQAIDHLLARIDTLEQAVDGLANVMQQGPGLAAMVGDMADEAYRKADDNGVNIDERLKNALVIAEKLTSPTMMEKLESLVELADQAPGLSAMMGDVVDETYREAANRGVDIDQRLRTSLEIAEKLTTPEMAQRLNSVLQLADQMPGLIAMSMDAFDEFTKQALEKGYDTSTLFSVAQSANRALIEAKAEPPGKIGVFGLLRAMNDPDRQRAMSFMMNFLKHLGKHL